MKRTSTGASVGCPTRIRRYGQQRRRSRLPHCPFRTRPTRKPHTGRNTRHTSTRARSTNPADLPTRMHRHQQGEPVWADLPPSIGGNPSSADGLKKQRRSVQALQDRSILKPWITRRSSNAGKIGKWGTAGNASTCRAAHRAGLSGWGDRKGGTPYSPLFIRVSSTL